MPAVSDSRARSSASRPTAGRAAEVSWFDIRGVTLSPADLASLTGRAELASIPADAPLFGDAVGLDSLTGTLLLREIHRRYGVDVAAEDLNLDALATLGTLASFVAGRGTDARGLG